MKGQRWFVIFIGAIGSLFAQGCEPESNVIPPQLSVPAPAPSENEPLNHLEPEPSEEPARELPSVPKVQPRQDFPTEWKPLVQPRKWTSILIHHTATAQGSVEGIHESHLRRGWQGIGYDFVIGNGKGMSDGAIEPTFRWRQQLQGAHAGNKEYNNHSIGICLVGNFEKGPPTAAQLDSLKSLLRWLSAEYAIPPSRMIGHRDVTPTACPGQHFPLDEVRQSLHATPGSARTSRRSIPHSLTASRVSGDFLP